MSIWYYTVHMLLQNNSSVGVNLSHLSTVSTLSTALSKISRQSLQATLWMSAVNTTKCSQLRLDINSHSSIVQWSASGGLIRIYLDHMYGNIALVACCSKGYKFLYHQWQWQKHCHSMTLVLGNCNLLQLQCWIEHLVGHYFKLSYSLHRALSVNACVANRPTCGE